MAFPSNATVLDDFNRTNGGLGASWTEFLGDVHAIVSNQVTGPSGAEAFAGYDLATYGPDSEVYIDVATLGGTDQPCLIFARMTTLSIATIDGYCVVLTIKSGTDTQGIYRIDNGVFTQLGATISNNFTAGNSLGLEIVGSTIKVYKKASGTWSDISSGGRNDTTYGSAGYLMMDMYGNTFRIDNFSGGTVVTATAKPWYVMWQ